MKRTIRVLDGCCGAGGAAVGYHQAFTEAGYDIDITGVDVHPQKNYPFRFWQGDIIEHLMRHGREYDFIHVSPPCQDYTIASKIYRNKGKDYGTAWLLPAVYEILQRTSVPWVIENVVGAPMHAPVRLCGSMFGLNVVRHRLFDSSHMLYPKGQCLHTGTEITVTGHGTPSWNRIKYGKNNSAADSRAAMGIDWMNRAELSQAIPPAYTRWLGRQITHVLAQEGAVA
jgi:DNA (cytosine-5)-methyltransferase 1